MKLTAERLRNEILYDPGTGLFTRKATGQRAGWGESHGYRKISIGCVKYYEHRLAWLYMIGEWPKNKIDHIDGDRSNNAFANLREATDAVNAQNIKNAQTNNKLGLLGVYQKSHRFIARIYANGRETVIGRFDSAEEAHVAYLTAKRIVHEGCTI